MKTLRSDGKDLVCSYDWRREVEDSVTSKDWPESQPGGIDSHLGDHDHLGRDERSDHRGAGGRCQGNEAGGGHCSDQVFEKWDQADQDWLS